MLSLYISRYGMPEGQENYVECPGLWFDNQGDETWIMGEMERAMIKDVDNSEVISPFLIQSPILGAIPPSKLSGTVKTLILIKNDPEHIFNGAWIGNDATTWLLKIGEMCDRTVRQGYIMPFTEPFCLHIVNSNRTVTESRDYISESVYWGGKDLGV